MRLSTIIVTLALSVGLAIAGPIVDREDAVSVTGTDDGLPKYGDAGAGGGDDAPAPGRRGVTKRDDFNPLDARGGRHGRDFAILIVCHREHCRGPCWGYNLDHVRFHKCYNVHKYRSVYIFSRRDHHDDDGHHHHRGHDDDDDDDGHRDKGGHHDEEYGVYVAKHRKCKRMYFTRNSIHFILMPYLI